jgi:hypothetical protein
MRRRAAIVTLTLAGWAGVAVAQDRRWQPVTDAPAVTLGPPTVTLGPPTVARQIIRGQSGDDGFRVSQWAAALTEPDGGNVPAIAPLAVPSDPMRGSYSAAVTASASVPYSPPTYSPPASPIPYDPPPLPDTGKAPAERKGSREHKSYFGEMFQGMGGNGPEGKCLESDHCFEYFASPVSNPFYSEDPRSLTEARPIFIYQRIPGSNPLYKGGNTEFFGSQFRVAITDQWSFVMNKLGGVSVNPSDNSVVGSNTGFAEIWLGPKWTFLRNTETGTVAAAGVTFQIPSGPPSVIQDTGTLSIAPYVSAAQNFGCTNYGSFNAMGTIGYTFSTNNQRSDYLFSSAHLDFDVGNQHRLYPLVEMNWFHYGSSGAARPLDFEGADLFNFGSTNVSGRNNLSIATGVRYKFSECVQTGIVAEFPLVGTRDMNTFRLGVDFIFRY